MKKKHLIHLNQFNARKGNTMEILTRVWKKGEILKMEKLELLRIMDKIEMAMKLKICLRFKQHQRLK